MQLLEISKIPTKEKKQLINAICLMYKRIQKTKDIFDPTRLMLSDSKKMRKISNFKTLSLFESILALLPNEERKIIEKDFINNEQSSWYLNYYSKTTYYKMKNQAMDNFLFLFFN